MTITAWVAVVLFVSATSGTIVVSDDDVHKTRAECEAKNAAAIAAIKDREVWQDVLAYGTLCAPIAVTEVQRKAPAAGTPPIPPAKRIDTI